jgi:hypothetical protein
MEAKSRKLRIVGHELIDYNTGAVIGQEYFKWFEAAWKSAVEHGMDK